MSLSPEIQYRTLQPWIIETIKKIYPVEPELNNLVAIQDMLKKTTAYLRPVGMAYKSSDNIYRDPIVIVGGEAFVEFASDYYTHIEWEGGYLSS